MKTFKLALSAAATLIVTACGGSGSGGHHSPDTSSHTSIKPNTAVSVNTSNNHAAVTNNGANNNTHQPPVHPNQNTNTQATGKVTGHYVVASSHFQARHANVAGNDLERIVIDGVPISLKPGHTGHYIALEDINEDIVNTARRDKDRKSKGLLNKELKHVVYGWVDKYEGLPGNQRYGFVQGVESKSVPQKGKFNYFGGAFLTADVGQKLYQEIGSFLDTHVSYVDIDVDFDTKKLNGRVATLLHGDIALQADIKGSKFEGAHANGTVTKGAFYGPNAAELAGTFVNVKNPNNAYAGVFGAENDELKRD